MQASSKQQAFFSCWGGGVGGGGVAAVPAKICLPAHRYKAKLARCTASVHVREL